VNACFVDGRVLLDLQLDLSASSPLFLDSQALKELVNVTRVEVLLTHPAPQLWVIAKEVKELNMRVKVPVEVAASIGVNLLAQGTREGHLRMLSAGSQLR
jgi:hypothetical protein